MRQRMKYMVGCNEADTVFTKAWQPTVDSLVDFFSSFGTPNERMTAYYLQGRVHHDLGEAPQALDCYQQAAEQADTTQNDCDLRTLYAVYGQMADLFDDQYLPENEMEALKTAERIAWKDGDTLAAIKVHELKIKPYFLKAEQDSMLLVMQEARRQYLQLGHRKEAAQAIYSSISILLDRNDIQKAGHYLDLYERESGNFDENGELIFGGHYYCSKGRYLLAVGQMDSARYYFHKALGGGQKEAGYKGLLSVYEKKNIPDSIAKYARLFASANDSSFLHVNQEKVHQITAMYDYSHHRQMAEESKAKAARFMQYILLLLFAIVVGITSFSYLYSRKRMKSRLQISQLLNAKSDLQTLLDETQRQIDDLQGRQNEEIERIRQEHSQTLTDYLGEKEALQLEIDKLNETIRRTSVFQVKDAFSETDICRKFNAIKGRIPALKAPSGLDWSLFQKTFKEYFPDYVAFLAQDHTLTKEQLRICMLLPLNFKESEMAFFLGVDGQRIDRLKSQINKKLFNESSSKSLRKNLNANF